MQDRTVHVALREKLIVIEGPDGAGKTTMSGEVAKVLNGDWRCFPDRRTHYGQLIHAWLKGDWSAKWDHKSVIGVDDDLLNAAVFQAIQTINRLEVIDHLMFREGGPPLILDRYWPSGYAYGSADGLDPDLMIKLHARLPQPHLMILLEIPLEEIEVRMKTRGDDKREFYEKKGWRYFERIVEAYDGLWRLNEGRSPNWKRIPFGNPAETFERIVSTIMDHFAGSEAA